MNINQDHCDFDMKNKNMWEYFENESKSRFKKKKY